MARVQMRASPAMQGALQRRAADVACEVGQTLSRVKDIQDANGAGKVFVDD